MYGKWVFVLLGDTIECKVWVNCTPNTTEDELQRRAKNILIGRLI